jgi:hypothetical protein
MPPMIGQVRRVALAVVWLAVAALISLGAAGLVGAMAHQPGTASRAELTYLADRAIEPHLTAAEDRLIRLTDQVRRLGQLGRGALASLVANDTETLESSVSDGEDVAVSIQDDSNQLRRDLEAMPGVGPEAAIVLSPEVRRRHDLMLGALAATDGLSEAWSRLAAGSIRAIRLTVLLGDHDRKTGEAAAAGRDGKYAEALKLIDESDAMIVEGRGLRDNLAATVDVTTLTQWLDLNAEYDAALRNLYQSIVDSNGRVTAAVRNAFAAEKTARDRLPSDTKGLAIILAEIGRGGLNQAVIGIEEARADLEAAVEQLGAEPAAEQASEPVSELP